MGSFSTVDITGSIKRVPEKELRNYRDTMKRKKNIGSNFEDFLEEEGIREEVNATAVKAVIARSLKEYMKKTLNPFKTTLGI